MKFTRRQELFLIDLGLKTLLDSLISLPRESKESRSKGRKWSKTQRKKFASTMQKKFSEDSKESK
jgi:hypothetical protein